MISKEQLKAGIYGLTIGDCLGVPVEFNGRYFFKDAPVTGMIGYGTYNKKPGTWSDDTSLSLATLDGMIGKIDIEKIANNFVNYVKHGAFCQEDMFDIGNATSQAIRNIEKDIKSNTFDFKHKLYGCTEDNSSGNGSLMRMIPVALYLYDKLDKYSDTQKRKQITYLMSSLTHATKICLFGCRIYVEYAIMLLQGKNKHVAFKDIIDNLMYTNNEDVNREYNKLLSINFKDTPENEIKSTGYIVDSLEASIWCFLNTDNYADAVLKAVNLGDDTDTVGCITGGLAGIYYGYESIPEKWVDTIYKREIIDNLIDAYMQNK